MDPQPSTVLNESILVQPSMKLQDLDTDLSEESSKCQMINEQKEINPICLDDLPQIDLFDSKIDSEKTSNGFPAVPQNAPENRLFQSNNLVNYAQNTENINTQRDQPEISSKSTSNASLDNVVDNVLLSENNLSKRSMENVLSNITNIGRRNSLPEDKLSINSCNFIIDKDADSISMSDFKIDPVIQSAEVTNRNTSSIHPSKTKNKQVDMKNVVKNVHGLFSLVGGGLKNAYKPMEKNFGEIVQATQKNLIAVKNDYLKYEKASQYKVGQNLDKYNTLNLLSESNSNDEMFKKCEKFTNNKLTSNIPNNIIPSEGFQVSSQKFQVDESKFSILDEKSSENSSINDLDSCNSLSRTSLNDNLDEVKPSNCISVDLSTINDEKISDDDISFKDTITHYVNDGVSCQSLNEKTEILEKAVSEMQNELSVLKSALIQKDAIKKNLESRINLLMKQLESITIERDASVVRYAVSERNLLEAIKSKEIALASEQTARREATTMNQKLHNADAARNKAIEDMRLKCQQLFMTSRELTRLKEESQSCEEKLTQTQSKLINEIEAHKETSALVENLSFRIKQIETGNFPSPANSIQSSDIESQFREKEAMIILERHEREKVEARCKQLQFELDQLKIVSNKNAEEARELRAQVEAGAAESAALRRTCSELREQGAKDCERLAIAQARAARCDTLTVHLQQEQERSAKLMQELEQMKMLRDEALAEGELKARREAELLRQAERLTAVGVKLQATCSEAEAKALALTVDNASLREAAAKSAADLAEARLEIVKEREGRASDARALASRAAQHARGEREALTALEAARGEARVLTTKHSSAIKELKRELQQAKKKYERLEAEGRSLPQIQTQLSSERTGSCSSLSSYEGHIQQNHTSENSEASHDILVNTPDRQQLVERIVSLQRAAARRGEKLEFMEEHSRQLTQELQKKTRLLRALLVTAPSGSLSSSASDIAKAEIGKHGGVMASVYGSQVTDETMTLELSLEINAKLQSLLEDTLLSNITLKENMDTLGDEIARLKEIKKKSTK